MHKIYKQFPPKNFESGSSNLRIFQSFIYNHSFYTITITKYFNIFRKKTPTPRSLQRG